MAYTILDKSNNDEQTLLNNKGSKDNFPEKTKSAIELLAKVGLPKDLHPKT